VDNNRYITLDGSSRLVCLVPNDTALSKYTTHMQSVTVFVCQQSHSGMSYTVGWLVGV